MNGHKGDCWDVWDCREEVRRNDVGAAWNVMTAL